MVTLLVRKVVSDRAAGGQGRAAPPARAGPIREATAVAGIDEPPPADALHARVWPDFAAAEPCWRAVLAGDPAATFFASPGWQSVWWRHHGGGRRLLLVGAYRGDQPAGAGAFVLGRRGPVPVIQFCGTGAADYGAIVVDERRAVRPAVVWTVLDAVRARAPAAVLDLHQVPDAGGLPGAVLGWAAARRYRVRCLPQVDCPYQRLPPDEAALVAALRPSALRQERRQLRALGRLGQVRVQPHGAEAAGLDAVVAAMTDIERSHPAADRRANHWLGRSGGFLRDLLRVAAAGGQLWLGGMWVADQLIAYSVAFRHRDVLYGYLKGYHGQYARHSPGALLHLTILRAAVREGIGRLDYLRGAEAYKQEWQTDVGRNVRLLLRPTAAGPLARWAGAAYLAGPTGRAVLARHRRPAHPPDHPSDHPHRSGRPDPA